MGQCHEVKSPPWYCPPFRNRTTRGEFVSKRNRPRMLKVSHIYEIMSPRYRFTPLQIRGNFIQSTNNNGGETKSLRRRLFQETLFHLFLKYNLRGRKYFLLDLPRRLCMGETIFYYTGVWKLCYTIKRIYNVSYGTEYVG